jgi:hypothetical protein
MPAILIALPGTKYKPQLKKSFDILQAAHWTVSDLLALFDNPSGQPRGAGKPSNTEQDLLRSMLIFAGAGLDSSIKKMIIESLPDLTEQNKEVADKVVEHFSTGSNKNEIPTKQLVKWLFNSSPKTAILDDLIEELTGSSLQSRQQIEKIIDYLKVDKKVVFAKASDAEIKAAFVARNHIIHQLDVDFDKPAQQGKQMRTQRSREEMLGHTNLVLGIAFGFLQQVNAKLK